MAVHAALAFIIPGLGITTSVWQRKLFPLLTGIAMAIVSLYLWQVLQAQQESQIMRNVGLAALSVRREVQATIGERILTLERMAHRWEVRGGIPKDEWEVDVKNHVNQQLGYQAIAWVDPGFFVRRIVPLNGNEAALNFDLTLAEQHKETLEKARKRKVATVTPFMELVQGRTGFLVYIPLFVEGRFDGFILGVFRAKALVETILKDLLRSYSLKIVPQEGEPICFPGFCEGKWGQKTIVSFLGSSWDIYISPRQEVLGTLQSAVPQVVLVAGLVIAVLLSLTIHFACQASLRNHELQGSKEVLQRYAEELERSNAELDDFAYTACHDLKEPLRGITYFSTHLLELYRNELDGQGKSKLETLQRLTHRMEKLIGALFHYSRVGRTQLAIAEVGIHQLVLEVIDSLHLRLEECKVEVRIPEPLPSIRCDTIRTREIFANLITNAMKYNDKSEKKIEIGYTQKSDRSPIIFYVKDNGIGIKEEHFEPIFNIFRRLHPRDEFGGGTGAGLTIVKKIVERHQGKIWVESIYGEGSTFFFVLQESMEEIHDENTSADLDCRRQYG